MTSSKKGLRWLLALGMALILILSACNQGSTGGENNTEGSNPTPAPTSAPATDDGKAKEEAETLEPVTLKWVIGGPGKQKDSDKVWAAWNEKLKEILPNTTVEFEVIPFGEYKERWDLMMAAGEQVDIAWTGWVVPFAEEVAKGSYLPLNELIANHAPDLKKELPEWVLNIGGIDGEVYAVPNFQQMTSMRVGMRTPTALAEQYWDVEKAQQIFFDDVSSGQFRNASMAFYNEVENYLKTLKDNGKIQKGITPLNFSEINAGVSFPGQTMMRRPNKGQKWDFTIRPHYELEELKRFNDVFHDWYEKGYVRQDWLSLDNPRDSEGKPDGNVGWFHSAFEGDSQRETLRYGFDVTVVPMDPEFYITELNSSTSTAIPRTSVNPERAIRVLELMHTQKGKDLYNMLVFGLEGEHYEKVSDNRIKTLHYDGKDGTADSPYGLARWAIGNTFNVYQNQSDPEGWNDYLTEVHNNAITMPFVGFKPDTSMLQNELAQIGAASAEFKDIWAYPDYEERWQQMVGKLKTAGIEKVAAEMQRQLDEFIQKQGIQP